MVHRAVRMPCKEVRQPVVDLVRNVKLGQLSNKVEWWMVSKALLKSMEMTTTYGLTRSNLVTLSRMDIIAAVGEPVGRKANWLENDSVLVRDRRAG